MRPRDAWELERCDCQDSADVNCGGTSTHRLLSGFQRWRCAPIGIMVISKMKA